MPNENTASISEICGYWQLSRNWWHRFSKRGRWIRGSGKRGSGNRGTIMQGWKSRKWNSRHQTGEFWLSILASLAFSTPVFWCHDFHSRVFSRPFETTSSGRMKRAADGHNYIRAPSAFTAHSVDQFWRLMFVESYLWSIPGPRSPNAQTQHRATLRQTDIEANRRACKTHTKTQSRSVIYWLQQLALRRFLLPLAATA